MKKSAKKISTPHAVERGWFDRDTLCAMLWISPTQFDRRYQRLVGGSDRKTIGRKNYFRGRALIDAWLGEELDSRQRVNAIDGDDPLLAGEGSPALERYRLARAKLAEADVSEREKTTVRRTAVGVILRTFTNLMRGTTEAMGRRFGNDAIDLLNEAYESATGLIEKALTDLDREEREPA